MDSNEQPGVELLLEFCDRHIHDMRPFGRRSERKLVLREKVRDAMKLDRFDLPSGARRNAIEPGSIPETESRCDLREKIANFDAGLAWPRHALGLANRAFEAL